MDSGVYCMYDGECTKYWSSTFISTENKYFASESSSRVDLHAALPVACCNVGCTYCAEERDGVLP